MAVVGTGRGRRLAPLISLSPDSTAELDERPRRSEEPIADCQPFGSVGWHDDHDGQGTRRVELMQDVVEESGRLFGRLEPDLAAGGYRSSERIVPKVSTAIPPASGHSRKSSAESTRNDGVRGE